MDGVTSEKEMFENEQKKSKEGLSTEVLYKIEVAANRYDLLCIEGLALALKSFLQKAKFPKFSICNSNPDHIEQLIVEESVAKVRPVGMSAILRNIQFNDESIKGFMDLQDKLHNNICRGRTLVSMGTHDLDTVKGPFYYRGLKPEQIKFVPLNRTEEVDGNGLIKMLKDDPKLGKYLYMIEKEELFPAFVDSEGNIMSVPPIINSERTKIRETTKNVFLDITATDFTKANIVLNTLIAMFSCYCEKPFTVEQVNVVDAKSGKVTPFPNLNPAVFKADINYLKSISGVPKELKAEEICTLLEKMELESTKLSETEIEVKAPITRSDILHPCDIAEDLAIAYGYNNVEIKEVETQHHGKQLPYNKLTDIFRREMAMGGYVEFLTMSLLSRKEILTNMLIPEEEEKNMIKIGYAKTKDLDFVRNSLIPGLLKSIEANKAVPLPYKIFEISDCCQIDPENQVGACNRRKLCFAYSNTISGFEILQGMVDKLMKKIDLEFNSKDKKKNYTIKRSEYPHYFEDRQADLIILDGIKIGSFGVVHPKVLKNFGIKNPVSICEIDIQKVFDLIIDGTLIGGFY
ncbi:MAG: phenylalanine--tRNA ligase subunit beta [archaeon]|nr:phenylalanine--tRNA ligase subunit beta [archaeon]